MNLSRKRKKELRKLQNEAENLWETQQELVGAAAGIAREAGRQLGNFNREQVIPAVQDSYERHLAPSVNRGIRAGRHFVDDKVAPAVGGVIGTAMSAWDVASAKRRQLLGHPAPVPQKKGLGLGSIIAIVLGAAAAIGVAYAAWQALRADDELWVADDPLSPPNA